MQNPVAFFIAISIVVIAVASSIYYDNQKKKKDKQTKNDQPAADLNDIYNKLNGIYNILVFFVVLIIIGLAISLFNLVIQ